MRKVKTPLLGVLIVVVIVAVAILALGLGGMFTGQASISLTIIYDDGTKREVNPQDNPLGLITPLKITDSSGKSVSRVDFTVQVKASYTGTVSSASYAGSAIYVAVDQSTKKTYGESVFSGTPTSGSWATVASGSVSGSDLNTWATTTGSHQLNITPMVVLKLTFTDGRSESKDASCQGSWAFNKEVDGSFTSLSVQVTHSPFT